MKASYFDCRPVAVGADFEYETSDEIAFPLSEAKSGLEKFEYRAMVFVNLKLEGQSGLSDVVTWVPEREYPFFRQSDIGMGLVPAGKSQVTCDIGCKVGDKYWTMSDEDLATLLSEGRNGEFAHVLMEDVFWRTRWKVSDFLKNLDKSYVAAT